MNIQLQSKLRRIFLTVSLLVVWVSACGAPTPEITQTAEVQQQPTVVTTKEEAPTQRTLVVSGWGGLWEEAFLQAVAEPFEREHPGVTIIHVLTPSMPEMIAKLRAEINNPTIDVVGMGGGFERVLVNEGLTETLDPNLIPNMVDVLPAGNYKDMAIANSYNGVGLAYNTERVPRIPDSWYDLWDPAFNPVAITDISETYGRALFAGMNEFAGGTQEDQSPAWALFGKLMTDQKPLINYTTDDTVSAIVSRGAVMSVAGNSRAIQLMSEGYPLGFVYPKEGGFAWGTYISVMKGSPNIDLAMEFINYWLDPEVDARFCALVNYGPGNSKAVMPSDYPYSEYLIYGDSMDTANALDWDYLNLHATEWNERWTTEILPLLQP